MPIEIRRPARITLYKWQGFSEVPKVCAVTVADERKCFMRLARSCSASQRCRDHDYGRRAFCLKFGNPAILGSFVASQKASRRKRGPVVLRRQL